MDYWFVSREAMEADIAANKFIDAGVYNDNLYGTTLESVLAVARAGKHCILDVGESALDMLKSAQLEAIVIFLRPASAAVIREQQNASLSDEELNAVYAAALEQEASLVCYIQAVIVNKSIEETTVALKRAIRRHATDANWVATSEPI